MADTKKTPQYLTGYYTCWLPVFKQGDDLHSHLEKEETVADAFEALAQRYEAAAAQCRRMVGVAREIPDIEVDADTHHIGVRGPVDRMELLVVEGLLGREDYDEEREATHASFTEHLLEDRDGKGPFTVEQATTRAPELDPPLAGLNPEWVRETLDGMVKEGSLEKVGEDQFKVVDDPEA